MVEVALVVVEFVAMKSVRVEDALEINPEAKFMVVEVEFSPVPNLVNGYAKVSAAGKVVRHSVPMQSAPVARVVEVAFVVVLFDAVKF